MHHLAGASHGLPSKPVLERPHASVVDILVPCASPQASDQWPPPARCGDESKEADVDAGAAKAETCVRGVGNGKSAGVECGDEDNERSTAMDGSAETGPDTSIRMIPEVSVGDTSADSLEGTPDVCAGAGSLGDKLVRRSPPTGGDGSGGDKQRRTTPIRLLPAVDEAVDSGTAAAAAAAVSASEYLTSAAGSMLNAVAAVAGGGDADADTRLLQDPRPPCPHGEPRDFKQPHQSSVRILQVGYIPALCLNRFGHACSDQARCGTCADGGGWLERGQAREAFLRARNAETKREAHSLRARWGW